MVSDLRAWLAGAAALVLTAVAGVAILTTGEDATTDPETGAARVTEIDGTDEIRAAFDADHGHPRLILLVDPT